jgi:hypothetical protein
MIGVVDDSAQSWGHIKKRLAMSAKLQTIQIPMSKGCVCVGGGGGLESCGTMVPFFS